MSAPREVREGRPARAQDRTRRVRLHASELIARLPSSGALGNRAFRALSIAFGTSEIGTQMQVFALGWLAIELAARDGSPSLASLYVGLLGLARAVPGVVLGVFGGVLADRLDRRALILASQAASALCAAGLALVAAGGWGGVAAIMMLVLAAATAYAFTLPAEYAALPRLVPSEDLMSGIGLLNASANVAMFVGPLAAGALIAPIGVAGILVTQAALHLVSALTASRLPAMPRRTAAMGNAFEALREGVTHSIRDPLVRALMAVAVLVALFGRSVAYVMPVVSTDVLNVGAIELSWLLAARGLGTLGGSLAITSLGGVRRRATAAVACALAFGVAAALFAVQSALVPALVVAMALGLLQFLFSGFLSVVLQLTTPDELRGRVLSLYLVTVSGITPLGVMLLGAAGAVVGIGPAIAVGAGILVAGCALVLVAPGPVRAERGAVAARAAS